MRYATLMLRSALVVLCASRVALAQSEGPAAGTWAIEGGPSVGGALLHFRSMSSATVIGGSAFFSRLSDASGTDLTFASAEMRLGIRKYAEPRNKVRRFSTVSATLGFARENNPATTSWNVGAAADMGAAYFFTPHASMGGSGELNAAYGFGDGPGGGRAAIAFAGFRLLGTVYF